MKILSVIFGLLFCSQAFAKIPTIRWPGSLEEREQALTRRVEKAKRDDIRLIGAYIRAHGGAAPSQLAASESSAKHLAAIRPHHGAHWAAQAS